VDVYGDAHGEGGERSRRLQRQHQLLDAGGQTGAGVPQLCILFVRLSGYGIRAAPPIRIALNALPLTHTQTLAHTQTNTDELPGTHQMGGAGGGDDAVHHERECL
jgi:hypothetical protein